MKFMMAIVLFIALCMGDTYMHYPRGSNNRLNEKSANRQNGNRMFDSQNNNRGGYNVGDMHKTNGFTQNNAYGGNGGEVDMEEWSKLMYDYNDDEWLENGNTGKVQYEEMFVENSQFKMTWTNQHGCGNPKNNCNVVVQWTCDTHAVTDKSAVTDNCKYNSANAKPTEDGTPVSQNCVKDGMRVQLLAGRNTGTPNDPNNFKNVVGTKNANDQNGRGRNEAEEWYQIGKTRGRQERFFTADQKLQGNKQIHTRQNPGGTRRGLEIPEERDYYPWDFPSIWHDLAILHNNVDECKERMADFSQNVSPKCACYPPENKDWNDNDLPDYYKPNDEKKCKDANGRWLCYTWDSEKPACIKAPWTSVNNLGNVQGSEQGGLPPTVDFEVPTIASLEKQGCYIYEDDVPGTSQKRKYARLVMRTRYNMTTMDYAPYETDSTCNEKDKKQERIQSPVEQNPTVDVGAYMQGLRLAINTAQLGRTFQDRSHPFRVMAEVTNSNMARATKGKIYNLNVQGKRGNIVQTYPAVEYDFWPRELEINKNDCLAFQWTGSNTHNNGNPAGDGQAGDAGEGRGGSDRHNIMQLLSKDKSYPIPLDQFPGNFWESSNCYRTFDGKKIESKPDQPDVQVFLASGGFYNSEAQIDDRLDDKGQDGELDPLMNNAPASMRGITCCPQKTGEYFFSCTRNNNFSNRDQKLKVTVV